MKRNLFALLLLATVGVAVYLPLGKAPFLLDDSGVMEHDPVVARCQFEKGDHCGINVFDHLWLMPRPLRQLTLRLEYKAAGLDPAPGHLVNIGLHFAVALAGFLLLARLGVRRDVGLAAVALFLLNPVAVESVGIVSHRKEMLSALFLLLGLCASMARSRPVFLLSFPCFLLAVLGKETAAVFPGLQLAILLSDRFRTGGKPTADGSLRRQWPAFLLFAIALCLLAKAQISASTTYLNADPSENHFRAGNFFKEGGWADSVFAAVVALPRYLASFSWPFGHCLDPSPWSADAMVLVLCALACAAYGAVVWLVRRTRFFLPLAWIPVALFPYLLPPLLKSGDTAFFADRYAYLALLGFSWLVAEAVYSPVGLRGNGLLLRHAAALALCAWFAIPAHRLCSMHTSAVTFWAYVCDKSPESPYAHLNLANALQHSGAPKTRVEKEFGTMAKLAPDFVFGILRFADFHFQNRRPADGWKLLDELLAQDLRPLDRAEALRKHGCAHLAENRQAEALEDLEEARRLGLATSLFHRDYGEALRKNLRWREAHDELMLASRNPRLGESARWAASLFSDPPLRRTGRLIVVGDSVPHGTSFGLDGDVDVSLTGRLSGILPALSFRDATIPGSTARALSRALGNLLDQDKSIAACIIMTGHNDAFFGRSAGDLASDIAGCALAARFAGVVPIVIGPIPVQDAPGKDRSRQERTLAEIDAFLNGFCPSANIAYLSFRNLLKSSGTDPADLLVPSEGNHLNDRGMELLASMVADAVAKRIGVDGAPDRIPPPFGRPRVENKGLPQVSAVPPEDVHYDPKTPGCIRFALCQTPCGVFAASNRVDETFAWVRKSLKGDEDVIVFPELAFASFPELGTAWRQSPIVWEKASAFARERRAWILVNHPNRPGPESLMFNETRVFAPDGTICAVYRKRVLARMDIESSFTPGTTEVLAELPFVRIGLLICKDAFTPWDGGNRYRNADVLLVQFAHPGVDDRDAPEALFFPPGSVSRSDLRDASKGWEPLGKPFLAVNKVGPDGNFTLCGGTFAADKTGRIVAAAKEDAKVVFVEFPLDPKGWIRPVPLRIQRTD